MPGTAVFHSLATNTVLKRHFEVACIDKFSPVFICTCVLESKNLVVYVGLRRLYFCVVSLSGGGSCGFHYLDKHEGGHADMNVAC